MHIPTNGFEHIVEAAEIEDLRQQHLSRDAELRNARNLELVTVGKTALSQGVVSRDTIHAVTWTTVARQRELMRKVGYGSISLPETGTTRTKSMRVPSNPVRIASDLSIVLVQHATGWSTSDGFWEKLLDEGIESALDRYAGPGTTALIAHDRYGEAVMSQYLSPHSTSCPDKKFNHEWERSMLPFRGTEYCSPHDTQRRTDEAYRMTDKELVMAAGLNIVFNGLLDEVETNLPRC